MIIKENQIVSKIKYNKTYWFLTCMLFFVVLIDKTNAQQVPNYTQYLYNMQILNPAYVGSRADLSISALSRQQWVGVEGAPKTNTFSVNGRTQRGLGIGVTFVNDKLGLSESNNTNLDVAYTLITSQYSRLSFGLKGGITFFNNNLSNGLTPDNDVYASTSGSFINVGFGALFYNKKFYVGLSIPYLLESPQFYTPQHFSTGAISSNSNYFFSTGALFQLSENVLFKPSTILSYASNLPISIDVNANFLYKEIIETGLSYRNDNSLSALFSLILDKKYRIGYAYNHKIANLGNNLNTHEFILHVDLDFQRNTRWLLHNKCYF